MSYPTFGLKANEYQDKIVNLSKNYAVWNTEKAIIVYTLGLCEESGEVAGLLKRYFRGDYNESDFSELKSKLAKELGDVAAYLSLIAYYFDLELEDVLEENLAKIKKRIDEQKQLGSGSDR